MEVLEGREVGDSKDDAASRPDCWLINESVASARMLLWDCCVCVSPTPSDECEQNGVETS